MPTIAEAVVVGKEKAVATLNETESISCAGDSGARVLLLALRSTEQGDVMAGAGGGQAGGKQNRQIGGGDSGSDTHHKLLKPTWPKAPW